jgi:hypothetical protein
MKPVLFVICFTVGLCLMVFSGYVPQSANAHDRKLSAKTTADESDPLGQPLPRTVTRRVLTTEGAEPAESTAAPATVDANPAPVEPPAAETVWQAPATSDPELAIQSSPPADPPQAADPQSPPPEVEQVPVVANAGPDRVIWLGWDELPLDGSASTGTDLTYYWRQITGPTLLPITDEAQPITAATGLLATQRATWRGVTYEFELAVTDATDERATDRVKYIVQSAPALRIKPTPERHFESHDGYELAHFVSWTTNVDGYESTFEISSPTELNFTKVTGGLCDLSGGKSDGGYAYQAVVYGQAGEPSSWVEFLVDSEDKVPGVIQLGVSWEAR